MRIHSDVIAYTQQIRDALPAGVRAEVVNPHRSRSRRYAYEVRLTGTGSHATQWGTRDTPAATWDEWGMFLAKLYELDPNMVAANYRDAAHFHWTTGDRFRALTPTEQHRMHRWVLQGIAATGTYSVHACKGSKAHGQCTAITRYTRYARSSADLDDILSN